MPEFAHIAASGMLNSLVPGFLLFALAWMLSRILGRDSSAALRFSIWMIALCAIAILPWVGSFGAPSYLIGPAHATVSLALPGRMATYIFFAWLAGAALALAHLAHGLYRLMRLRAACRPVDLGSLDPLLRETLADVQSRRRITLCVSDAVRVPAALGYFRPVVVFPAWALSEIPPQELNAILLHEVAHLRRYDDWTNLAQKFAKAVFFFHPAVWFIESRLTLEREIACDEAVLAANFNPRDYAESLVSLAEKSFLRRGIQLAQAAVGHVKQLKIRLAEILRKDRQGSVHHRKWVSAIVTAVAVVSTFAISRAPQLVTFTSGHAATPSAFAGTLTSATEPHLQPVNLSYTVQPQPVGVSHTVKPAHLRITTAVPKAGRAFLQRAAANPVASEVPSNPNLLLSNFPVDLASTAGPVLLIFQGGELGPNGPMLWRVTIFRLSPAQYRAISGTVQKQI